MTRKAISFVELAVAALVVGLCLPAVLALMTGQEREVRHSAHELDIAGISHGRLGELEGQLATQGYPRDPFRQDRSFDLSSSGRPIRVREQSKIEYLTTHPGVFSIEIEYTWTEPYAGSQANRRHLASLLVTDPQVGLKERPRAASGAGGNKN